MKKIIAILLAVSIIFVFAGCTQKEEITEKNYTPITYTDFNNFATNKGYTSVENTNNSTIDFEKSFSIESDKKNGFNILFYEFKDATLAFKCFNVVMLTYESFNSEYSFMERNTKYGYYAAKDADTIVYISYVEDTVMCSIISNTDKEGRIAAYNELKDFLSYVQYPFNDNPIFINWGE